jgi:hypothetical protein
MCILAEHTNKKIKIVDDSKNCMKSMEFGADGYLTGQITKDSLMQYLEMCPFIKDKKTNKELV